MTDNAFPSWPSAVFTALRALDVRQVATVPDAGLSDLITSCEAEPTMTMVPLTTEEEGIAVLAGAWLGGQRGVLMMQSSGVGNCINMLSLIMACRFPLLVLVTMRGQPGEVNPWQTHMGGITGDVLQTAGVQVHAVDEANKIAPTVAMVGGRVFDEVTAEAILIQQKVIGFKNFNKFKF